MKSGGAAVKVQQSKLLNLNGAIQFCVELLNIQTPRKTILRSLMHEHRLSIYQARDLLQTARTRRAGNQKRHSMKTSPSIPTSYPEPESLTPDPKEDLCCCFEKVGDNPNCPIHGKKPVSGIVS